MRVPRRSRRLHGQAVLNRGGVGPGQGTPSSGWAFAPLAAPGGRLDHRRGQVRGGPGWHAPGLTRIEYDLLLALARHPGTVVSKQQLLAQVWNCDSTNLLDSNRVEVHICALRRKLEALGPRIVHTEYGFGYSLRT
ncbi:MAG TPA: winged helix-turn-helix domain-containing protein [Acidimicrobiales bacterium]|nr:winged helix-turn-helix domain-containing protein [Acidimicrobiales bacterium]